MKLFTILAALAFSTSVLGQSTPTAPKLVGTASAQSAQTAATGVSTYTTFVFNWAYTPSLPSCVSTNKSCWDGFILTNTTLGTVVGTQSQIPAGVTSYNYQPSGGVPYGTTNFSLVAHGYDENGAALSSSPATVAITVNAPAPTATIAASPSTVTLGGSSTLTVTATNSTSVVVKGSDGSSYTLPVAGGTQVVSPTATTTYTITATGQGGTITAQTTVTVHIASLASPTGLQGKAQ